MTHRYSRYNDPSKIAGAIERGKHRDLVGGLWDELGQLQLRFLMGRGLKREHLFIDIGSGCFRAGVKLIPYLEPCHYYAIDIDEQILVAGYEREIEPAGLAARFPRSHFAVTTDFDIGSFGVAFDYGIAQSVFTHLPFQFLSRCLLKIAPHFRSGGWFFATYFHVPDGEEGQPFRQPHGVMTYPGRDLYHCSLRQIGAAVAAVPDWRLEVIGDWSHPRHQRMLAFQRV